MTSGASDNRAWAVQLNNQTWDILSAGTVNAESARDARDRFLYGAYASAYHWRVAGAPANWARAEHLVSRVACAIGQPETALVHAQRCLTIIASNPGEMADWDAAFGYEALARALAGSGDEAGAAEAYAMATTLTDTIAEDGDREVLESELNREPWFGWSPDQD